MRRLVAAAAAFVTFTGGWAVGLRPEVSVRAAASSHAIQLRADFNGDGYPDLAIGIPNGAGGLGAVTVLRGSRSGLSTVGSQYWTLGTTGAHLRPAPGDQFGSSVAAADFNGDGISDLAIGVPGRNAVVVLHGSASGLQAQGTQLLHTAVPLGGFSIAAGDFNGDGYGDLAAGVPFATAGKPGAGVVEIHYGSAAGLSGAARGSAQRFAETSPGMPGPPVSFNDEFGFSFAIADFNRDGFADLAIGVPNGNRGAGGVVVLSGSTAGLTTVGSEFLPTFGSGGGLALAAGDFNNDGFPDLAIGEPNTTTSAGGAGSVEIHDGSVNGLTRARGKVFAEVTLGMPGPPSALGDAFGFSLTASDFNHDGSADLAVGITGKSAAIVLYGSGSGLTPRRSQFLGGLGPNGGFALAATDLNGDGFADLVVGAPFAATSQTAAGAIEVHPGSAKGVTRVPPGSAPVFSEDTAGMQGPPSAAQDNFGLSLSASGP